MIDELHPDEIEAVLHRHHVGRLACVVASEPYLVPITYGYRNGLLYGHSLPGQKLDAMRAEPRVAFEVDERWEADTWRSVVVRGVFEEVTNEHERAAAIAALHGAHPDATRLAEAGVLFRIRPTEKTGRSVRRAEPFAHHGDVEHPLQGIDLRAGDEANFPRGDTT
jgi:nitroimidazol reductase NimA-like FMN-containing flavoprotein (pyridoxamine 5'-phosphate oxidase superfamily)